MSFETQYNMIASLKDENSQAWENFFSSYVKLIRLHGKDCGIKEEYLDDLVQDVMISISKACKTFQYDPDKGRFRDFLKRIIRARAADILRKYYRREANLLQTEMEETLLDAVPDLAPQPDEALDEYFSSEWKHVFIKNCLRVLKNSINPKHYQIFFMLEIQKQPVTEVAAFSGLSPVTIYSIRSRVENKLAQVAEKLLHLLPEENIFHENQSSGKNP